MIAAFGNDSMNSLMFDFLFVNLVGFDHSDKFGERPRVKKLFEMRQKSQSAEIRLLTEIFHTSLSSLRSGRRLNSAD